MCTCSLAPLLALKVGFVTWSSFSVDSPYSEPGASTRERSVCGSVANESANVHAGLVTVSATVNASVPAAASVTVSRALTGRPVTWPGSKNVAVPASTTASRGRESVAPVTLKELPARSSVSGSASWPSGWRVAAATRSIVWFGGVPRSSPCRAA